MPDLGDRDLRDIARDQRDAIEANRRETAEVRHDLNGHKQIVDIKLTNLQTSVDQKLGTLTGVVESKHEEVSKKLDDQTSILKWAGGLITSLILSFMGWALLQQYNANEAQKKDLSDQVHLLQEQERVQAANRDQILAGQNDIRQSLTPGGSAQTTRRQQTNDQ